ncbi:glyoxalase/bleomycin resistance protein/dioxygenase family protein (plasmid) [Rhizobium sp. TAL182]|nr:glyoxalase/bleomycin resistance protein/dioxygenase family protein [Rhizobium sp. TAL182]
MLKSFEHVGMTVSDMDRSVDFYCGLVGLRLHLRKRMADGAEIAFLDAGGGMLEIFAPAGGAARAVDVPEGTAGLRHLTFLFDDVEETFTRLQKTGVEVKERPRLAINAEVLHKVASCAIPMASRLSSLKKDKSSAAYDRP